MSKAERDGFDDDPDMTPGPGGLCGCDLAFQNAAYQGTGGVSRNNRTAGFSAAYRNDATGETVLSRFADGHPAPVHLLEGLPEEWVACRDEHGGVCQVLPVVVAGFTRDGCFYTREQAAQLVAREDAEHRSG
jgi:hypothetical protein